MRKKIISFIGPPSSGKSSIIGRLLVDLGQVGELAIEDAVNDAKALGRRLYYSLLVDTRFEDREKGHTLRLNFINLKIDQEKVLILDTPGLITGLSDVVSALLASDAVIVVLEEGTKNNTLLRFYEELMSLYKIGQRLVVLNKADKIKMSSDSITGGPLRVSVANGEGMEEIIKFIKKVPRNDRPQDRLRLPVMGIHGVLNIAYGIIARGRIKIGDEVLLLPNYKLGSVVSIEQDQKAINEARAGEDIGIQLRGIGRQYIKRGCVISSPEHPPKRAIKMEVKISWMKEKLREGSSLIACFHTAQAQCRIEGMKGDEVILSFRRPICIEPYKEDIWLGVVVLRDQKEPKCVGMVISYD
ncbi:MAG: hypothetical protein DRJ66_01470 [Thermoprotei archaeon]|nr:MAG: hypothetical protein DRJ66_01470 [Thermoprotei archaeon]RLF18847.1 MAG: hypothetical protein DRZ82_07520 [Thermoprotei archaeon]